MAIPSSSFAPGAIASMLPARLSGRDGRPLGRARLIALSARGPRGLLRLADQRAETVDGALVGAEVVAVEGGLRLVERGGLLGEDAGERCWRRPARPRRRLPARGRLPEDLGDRSLQGGAVAEVVVEEGRDPAELWDRALARLDEDRLHVQQRVPDRHGQQVPERYGGALLVEQGQLLGHVRVGQDL